MGTILLLGSSLFLGQACGPAFTTAPITAVLDLQSTGSGALDPVGVVLYKANCASCHGDISQSNKSGADLQRIVNGIKSVPGMQHLSRLSNADLQAIARALSAGGKNVLIQCATAPDVGRAPLHRLNATEYNNTVRDLLGVSARPADKFPPDGYSFNFNNTATLLTITSEHVRLYLEAAETLMTEVFGNQALRQRLGTCDVNQANCVRDIVTRFAERAFRRPPVASEVDRLIGVATAARTAGESAEGAVRSALTAVLISPHFLYRSPLHPEPNNRARTVNLTQFDLASRLSYFLWSSMPDQELYDAAKAGTLSGDATLRAQIKRMLADAKATALIDNFATQWLSLNALERSSPSTQLFPAWNEGLRTAMRTETKMLIADIIRRDAPILEVLTAQHTFVNGALATHYGLAGVSGDQFQRVSLADGDRMGVLTHGSLMTATASSNRTSIVRRGKWVMDQFLCDPPPAAPPDVTTTLPQGSENLTLRARLEIHRADAKCASCHSKMDPIGFGLENFDAIGRWRTTDGSQPLDTKGVLPDGRSFATPKELANVLQADPAFRSCVAEKTMTYALGRELEQFDQCTINRLGAQNVNPDKPISEFIFSIVKSDPFSKVRGDEGVR